MTAVASTTLAADLGGNCCADLEERIAELEATAARKGNRKVRLTVSGHINEAVAFWDDGSETNAYVVSNNASRTRFRFVGDAKINADWSAGYLLEIGVRFANSASRNQFSTNAGGDNNQIDIRQSGWYLDSKTYGRIWVGEVASATEGITEISLANPLIPSPDIFFTTGNANFRVRRSGSTGQAGLSGLTWTNLAQVGTALAGEGDRSNVVKYVSPTFQGFTFQVAWGEDDIWDTALRYAGEFSGVRLAAGIGYRQINDFSSIGDGLSGCTNLSGTASESSVDCSAWGGSLSIMHLATGIYASLAYGQEQDDNRSALFGANVDDTAENFYITAGIERNWLGIGATTLYGEYFYGEFGASLSGGGVRTLAANDVLNSTGGARRISGTEINQWGFGINQKIDAAAMDLYIGYKNYSADASLSVSGARAGSVSAASIDDFQLVVAGAIIRF